MTTITKRKTKEDKEIFDVLRSVSFLPYVASVRNWTMPAPLSGSGGFFKKVDHGQVHLKKVPRIAMSFRALKAIPCYNEDRNKFQILATSAFSQTQILATKAINEPIYRKGFFDHLKPRAFITSFLRVTTQQTALITANFMSEQLEGDMKRQELVRDHKMSQKEADEQSKKWEKEEWDKRWKALPDKLMTAFAKFHAITIVMRVYESIAAKLYDKVTLHKLTNDPFRVSLNLTEKSEKQSNSQVGRQMFDTTFWANMIAFMADYSVHQAILSYGYYSYYKRKRSESSSAEETEELAGAIMTSMLKKSTQLMISRTFGLVCSSFGSAVGTIMWPGWGTLLCSNMGEGAAGVILDDGSSSAKK